MMPPKCFRTIHKNRGYIYFILCTNVIKKISFCQDSQNSFGQCSAMTSPNLSNFYISKKPLLVFQSSANLPNFRLPAPIGQNFERLVMVFLKYNNGSNLERSLLSIIQSFVANPSKMKNFLIRLPSKLESVKFQKQKWGKAVP